MKKTLYYVKSKEYGDIWYKCFDKEKTEKYMEIEHLDKKDYKLEKIKVDLDEFFKIRVIDMPKYLNTLIMINEGDLKWI